jgi:hypothetical protein
MLFLDWKDNRPINPDDFVLKFRNRFGKFERYYDDGFGPLWIFRNSMGIVGIVRCQTEHDAFEIVEDEFLNVLPEEELYEAYGFNTDAEYQSAINDPEKRDSLELAEGYSYQSNATGTGIVEHDLNGEELAPLTPDLLKRLELTIVISPEEK